MLVGIHNRADIVGALKVTEGHSVRHCHHRSDEGQQGQQ